MEVQSGGGVIFEKFRRLTILLTFLHFFLIHKIYTRTKLEEQLWRVDFFR